MMVLRGFRLQCTLRVLLLVATSIAFAWSFNAGRYATWLVLGALLAYQTFALIRYVEFTNHNLDLFLKSIEFVDFSHKLARGPAGSSFEDLSRSMNEVVERFREITTSREESLRYHQSVVQHVGTGVMAYDQQGNVQLFNAAARSLLDVPGLRNIDDLAATKPELHRKLRALQPGRRDLVTVGPADRLVKLSLHATELKRRRHTLSIVSIQNISPELNEKEMEAWRNLIRVLTHEIKNSLTPIASLAASVEEIVVRDCTDATRDVASSMPRVQEALQAIQRRSQGLLQFVNAYRDLTHIPEPEYRVLQVSELFARVAKLLAPQVESRPVRLRTAVRPERMTLTADPRLIEQVLINLLLNALQAAEGQADAEIALEAGVDARNRPVVKVTDNGPGILEASLEKVFVPFYSTRKDGSGIGLSLSRQIMRMHRGDLTVRSDPGVATTFTLRF
jgi:signal transduction histidine kinase